MESIFLILMGFMIHWLKLILFFNLTSGPNFGEYYNI